MTGPARDQDPVRPAQDRAADRALDEVGGWDLPRVVGQLFCVSVGHHSDGAYGFADSVDEVAQAVERLQLGGVCYFPAGPDGARPAAVAERLGRVAARATTPLLTTIDQEGGLVTRMREPATRWPSAMGQVAGARDRTELGGWVRRLARASALELRAAGAHQSFAPVADVNVEPGNPVIGIRSAGGDPDLVGDFVEATVRGFAEAGLGSCLKHFPGHGDTRVDSHVGLPTLTTTEDQWWATEAIPFARGIAAGVDSVMIGHLRAPGLDETGAPATFSRAIVTGLLRERLGFSGVIVTDALDMAGAQLTATGGRSGPAAACLAALRSGVDQLLMPRDPDECVAAVLEAVAAGELDEAPLRRSAARILALKARLGLLDPSGPVPDRGDDVDLSAHHRLADLARSRALTWRRADATAALDPTRAVLLVHDPEPPSAGRGIEDVPAVLADELRRRGFDVGTVMLGETPVARDDDRTTVVLVTRDAWRHDPVAAAVRGLVHDAIVDVAICARSPYDAGLLPEGLPTLFAYGDLPGVAGHLADALVAGVALGALPVAVPPTPPRAGPAVLIRPYRPEDRRAIGTICVRTGASGQDATGHFFSDDLLPFLYAYPYVDHEPECCLVVDVGGRVVGYVLGTADVASFTRWWREEWAAVFATRFPDDPAWTSRERDLVGRGLAPAEPAPDDEPVAELHIDLLPVVQGMGLGRELIDGFRALVAARGVRRLRLGVGTTNTGAVAFYRALGFTVVREHTNAAGQTVALTMEIPTGAGDDDDTFGHPRR